MEIVKDPVVKGLYRRIGESSATWYVQGRINNGSVTRVKLGRVALMSVFRPDKRLSKPSFKWPQVSTLTKKKLKKGYEGSL